MKNTSHHDTLLDIKALAGKHGDAGYDPYTLLEVIEQKAVTALAVPDASQQMLNALRAAPDMLEALQMARNFYGDGYDAEDETEKRVMNAIDAALAEGRCSMTRREQQLERALRRLIRASDHLTGAIKGVTVQFDPEVGHLMDAASAAEKVLRCSMKPPFTSEDASRLLQIGDQFLEDWEDDDGKDEISKADCEERRREWDAIRPMLVAAPDMLDALKDLLGDCPDVQGGICHWCGRDYIDDILSGDCPSDDCPAHKARAAVAKAGAA